MKCHTNPFVQRTSANNTELKKIRFKILTNLELWYLNHNSASNSYPNTFFSINISNSFEFASSKARVASVNSQQQEWVIHWQGYTMIGPIRIEIPRGILLFPRSGTNKQCNMEKNEEGVRQLFHSFARHVRMPLFFCHSLRQWRF